MTKVDMNAMSASAGLLRDLDEAVPAILALVAVIVADAAITTAAVYVAIGLAIAAMFAAFVYRDRSRRGRERQAAQQRFAATMSTTERRVRSASRYAPIAVVVVIAPAAGLRGVEFGALALGTFLAAQAAFVLWFDGRGR
jgi:HAMP domain-containing protein